MNFAINELTPQELELIINKKREYLHVLELDCLLLALEANLEYNNKGDNE